MCAEKIVAAAGNNAPALDVGKLLGALTKLLIHAEDQAGLLEFARNRGYCDPVNTPRLFPFFAQAAANIPAGTLDTSQEFSILSTCALVSENTDSALAISAVLQRSPDIELMLRFPVIASLLPVHQDSVSMYTASVCLALVARGHQLGFDIFRDLVALLGCPNDSSEKAAAAIKFIFQGLDSNYCTVLPSAATSVVRAESILTH